jgi:hypothetical protein
MNKIVRNLIVTATILAGFAATSYASLVSAPEPMPPGISRG